MDKQVLLNECDAAISAAERIARHAAADADRLMSLRDKVCGRKEPDTEAVKSLTGLIKKYRKTPATKLEPKAKSYVEKRRDL